MYAAASNEALYLQMFDECMESLHPNEVLWNFMQLSSAVNCGRNW